MSRGKVTLDQSVIMITRAQATRGGYSASDISQEYKINVGTAGNIIRYYGIFNMMETETREAEHELPDPLSAGKGCCHLQF